MEDYYISKLSVSDAAVLAALEIKCFTDPWSENALISTLSEESAELYGLFYRPGAQNCVESENGTLAASGTLAGYGGMYIFPAVQMQSSDESAVCYPGEAQILNIAVLPEYRRRGLADILFGFLLSRAEEASAQKVFLEVRESNVPAINLYKKHGFVPIGRRKRYYRLPNEDAILMEK